MKEFSELIKDKITSVYKEKHHLLTRIVQLISNTMEEGYDKWPPYLPAEGYNYEYTNTKTGVTFVVDADHLRIPSDYDEYGKLRDDAIWSILSRSTEYSDSGRRLHGECYYKPE